MVLALMAYRASLEQFPGQEKFEALHRQLPKWIDKLNLAAELEKAEDAFLRTPLGKADKQAAINAEWRTEGLGVLLWSLNRLKLPPYDEMVSPRKSVRAVGLSDELLPEMHTAKALKLFRTAQLRPASEIDRLATQVTLVNWRVRTYRLSDADAKAAEIDPNWHFAAYLRKHPSFKAAWLQGLRFEKGDLAIGKRAIFDADPKDVHNCGSIAVEREIAAYWLRGDDPVYSQVRPDTILLGLP
jgi:hypothetical protein